MLSKNRRRTAFLLLILFAVVLFLLRHTYDFLVINHRINPEILVVEGWLPEKALDRVKEEIHDHQYIHVLTTGFPFNKGFMIGSWGKVVFDVSGLTEASKDSSYEISILIRGTRSKGEFAHIAIYADSARIGDTFTSRNKKTFTFETKLGKPPDTIRVEFDNDAYTRYSDRNLFFYSVSVNGRDFPADNPRVSYYEQVNGTYFFRQHLSSNSATLAANYLILQGIPDTLISDVITRKKFRSRTYTSAMDIKKWLLAHGFDRKISITLITQGVHARRSYLSFKKAFGDSADIGIITIPDPEITGTNWWKRTKGWKKVLYELAGIVYISVAV